MIEFLAEKMTSFLFNNNTIKKDDVEMYNYAFETIIAFFINIFFILMLSIILDRFLCTFLFLLFYCPIRQFSGGYHAESYKGCLLMFIIIYLINYFILEKFFIDKNTIILIILSCISLIRIYLNSPFEHRQHELSIKQRAKYKKIVGVALIINFTVSIVAISFTVTNIYGIYTLSVINIIYIMIILGKIKQSLANM